MIFWGKKSRYELTVNKCNEINGNARVILGVDVMVGK